jgi:heptose I phosphotransferase
LVTREIVAGIPLEDWLRLHLPGDCAAAFAVSRRLIANLAGLVARFHEAGFFHRDLYLCHLFVAAGEASALQPTLIDLERVGHGRWWLRRRWFVKDLAALLHSTDPRVGHGRRLRFLKSDLQARQQPETWRWWARRIVAKQRRMARHIPRFG